MRNFYVEDDLTYIISFIEKYISGDELHDILQNMYVNFDMLKGHTYRETLEIMFRYLKEIWMLDEFILELLTVCSRMLSEYEGDELNEIDAMVTYLIN